MAKKNIEPGSMLPGRTLVRGDPTTQALQPVNEDEAPPPSSSSSPDFDKIPDSATEIPDYTKDDTTQLGGTEGDFIEVANVEKAEEEDYENEVQAQPEQLPPHDIDIPEEPEWVHVIARVWDADSQTFIEKDMGRQLLVPSGCDRSEYVSPYESKVKLKSALPRDLEADTNLYSTWQKNQWVSRRWVQEHLDQDINIPQTDKEIADDIPFILAAQGLPDPTQQVAQTAGLAPGSNNGAPLPPGPGPGRGNKFAPGDNLAGKPPPNGAPGTGV